MGTESSPLASGSGLAVLGLRRGGSPENLARVWERGQESGGGQREDQGQGLLEGLAM